MAQRRMVAGAGDGKRNGAAPIPGPTPAGGNPVPIGGTSGSVPRHWLREAQTQWSPRRVVSLDTESRVVDTAWERIHQLRVWAARMDVRDPVGGAATTHHRADGTTASEFLDWLESWCRADRPVWVYAHNLGYDAILLRLLDLLVARGWTVTGSHVSDGPVWWRLRRDRERLVLTDSTSVWPAPLEDIAKDMGRSKPPLPELDDDDIAGWLVRCRGDVELLADALQRAMAFWDDEQLGKWSLTGTGLGWQSYRHRFLDVPVLIDPNPDAAAFERQANYGGRREAYRVGEWKGGRFADIDFVNGYPQLATMADLPARRLAPFESMDLDFYRQRSAKLGILAECVVTTAVPVVPCRFGETILYPIGTFRTTLASPEIDLVLETGGTVTIGHGYGYQLGPTMRTWATWIRGVLTADSTQVDPVARRMVKHWSRAVFGRWTMRTTRKVELDAWPIPGAPVTKGRWVEYADRDCEVRDGIKFRRTGAPPTKRVEGWTVVDGDKHLALIQDQDPDNTFPAVWCWIEALCRVALWRAMQQAGPDNVWQCDTDGFVLGEVHRTRARRKRDRVSVQQDEPTGSPVDLAASLPDRLAGMEWITKSVFHQLRIIGPQHLWLGVQRRMAGIATDAVEIEPGVFESLVWPSYMSQVKGGHPGAYVQPRRQQKLRSGINPRWVLSSGRTLPVQLAIRGDRMVVEPPPRHDSSRNRITLSDEQHGVLLAATRR